MSNLSQLSDWQGYRDTVTYTLHPAALTGLDQQNSRSDFSSSRHLTVIGPRVRTKAGRMLGNEAGHVSELNKKKAIVVKSKNEINEAQIEESTSEFNPHRQHSNNGHNENLEENKEDETYEDMMEEEPEEDPEEEMYEESDESPEDVIYEERGDSEEEIVEEPKEEQEIDGETEEDPEEEIVEELEEDPEEEINEESVEERLAVENSHLSSAMTGDTKSKDLGNEPNEDPGRGEKVVKESESEPMSNFINPRMSSRTDISRTIKDQTQHLLEDSVLSSSSMINACKAGYQLKNASKMGSLTLEACESKDKYLNEEYLKLNSNVTSVVGEHDGEIGLFKVRINGKYASKQWGHGRSSGKCRQSRWDLKQEGETPEIDGNIKRRKTRWDDNDSQNGLCNTSGFTKPLELLMDPKTLRLKEKLMNIEKKLQSSEIHDERPPGERSPSPEPVYNSLGLRINTRDARIRQKLIIKKSRIICKLSKLAKTNLTFLQSPAKLVKKLFIPQKEYPSYNFLGLILGPKGNTQKKMEKETGAKIFIRGKGSGDPESEDEDLHVRVEAYNQQALDAAAAMIEKLLIPVADQNNDHKRAQLVELAKLRGTYKGYNICDLCKEQGHRTYACPLQDSTFNAVCCDICGSFGHLASICNASVSPQICNAPGVVSSSKDKSNKEVDPTNLYIGYLTPAIDEKRLKELFVPFGKIIKTTVVKDQTTGLSKGYGFIKFQDPSDAAAAVKYMNGYKMDGKMLAVRVAGQKPAAVPLHSVHVSAVPSNILGQTSSNYEPAKSMLPEALFSAMNNESLSLPSSSSFSGHNISVARTQAITNPPYDFRVQIPSSLPNSVSQFPGDPDYPGLKYKSYFSSSVMSESQNQMPETAKDSTFLFDFRFP